MRDPQRPRQAAMPADEPSSHRYGDVHVRLHPGEAVVSLDGDIDFGVAEALDGAVHRLAQANLPVHLDASRVAFCDSVVVHFLARLLRAGLSVRVSDSDDRLATLLGLAKAPAALIAAVRTSTMWRTPTDESEPAAQVSTQDADPPQQALAARLARLRREHRAAERARGSATRN